MRRIGTLVFAVAALAAMAVAAGKSYTISLFEPTVVGNTELKPGDYTLKMVDAMTIMIDGKADTKATVKVETGKDKYARTTVRVVESEGKSHVQEIRLGGTNTKLIFSEPGTASGN